MLRIALGDLPFCYFHSLLLVSFTSTFTAVGQSYKEFMEGGSSTQNQDYRVACCSW